MQVHKVAFIGLLRLVKVYTRPGLRPQQYGLHQQANASVMKKVSPCSFGLVLKNAIGMLTCASTAR